MNGAGDWIGRTLFLILAGMATYAVLMAMMSIGRADRPSPAGMDASPATMADRPARPVTPERPIEPVRIRPADAPGASPDAAAGTIAMPSTMAGQDAMLAKWAEALTWAILALAGFAAAGLIVLLKITAQLGRIADRDLR